MGASSPDLVRRPSGRGISGWEFGGYVLDEERRQLLFGGRRCHLPPQEFQLLRELAANGGVVGRQRLIELLWVGKAVREAALTKVIQKVRDRLEAPGESLIRTVYKVGYQLVPPVRRVGTAPQDEPLTDDLLEIGQALLRTGGELSEIALPVLRSLLQIAATCCRRGQAAAMRPIFEAAVSRLVDSHGPDFALTQLCLYYLLECRLASGTGKLEGRGIVLSLRIQALAHAEPAADWDARLLRLRRRIAAAG